MRRHLFHPSVRGAAILTLVVCALLSACSHERAGTTRFINLRRDTMTTTAAVSRVGSIEGFYGPESVRYDADHDLYYVSNMFGPGSAKDGFGYIARIAASDLHGIDIFIESGRNGVTLNAPKGMALQGDTLWVTDIDVVRGFDRNTGKPTRVIDLAAHRPQLLNDIAASPDGTLYVSDTGIAMTDKGVLHPGGDKVLAISRNGAITERTNAVQLGWPNGVAWDATKKRWIVVSFDTFRSVVYGLNPAGGAPDTIAKGKGRYDGVEVLADGSMLVTCWNDQTLHIISPDGTDHGLIGNLFTPADLGVDTRRNRVAVPLGVRGLVEVWQLPALAKTVAIR